MTTTEAPATLCAAFQRTAAVHPDKIALRTPDNSTTVTWAEYADHVRKVAAGLAKLGIKRGDTVAIMLTNRPEFHIVDTGVLHTGATPFSIYNTLAPEQIAYLFSNAGNSVVITEQQFLPVLQKANVDGQVKHFVVVDGPPEDSTVGAMTLAELEASGDPSFDFDAAWQAVEPNDVLTLIYTSGTTGPPKGVELTHSNLLSEMDALKGTYDLTHDDSVVSYLPDAHIANRWGSHYCNLRYGIQIVTVDDPRQLIAGSAPGPADVLRRGARGLVQGQGRHRSSPCGRARRAQAQARHVGHQDGHRGGSPQVRPEVDSAHAEGAACARRPPRPEQAPRPHGAGSRQGRRDRCIRHRA